MTTGASDRRADGGPEITRHVDAGEICCDPDWEAAYARFETPREEVEKFRRRLRAFGVDRLPKESRVIELFCGRGGGLVALEDLGFSDLAGVDLSETLLAQYRGDAKLHLADCRRLPFDDRSFDVVVVQGGLHHLPDLPGDLELVLSEVARILAPSGVFCAVEPWLTPFLRGVHFLVEQPIVRKFYGKGDALAAMIEGERVTYDQWLQLPRPLLALFHKYFETEDERIAWGKLCFAGRPRHA